MQYIVLDLEWNQPWPGSPSARKVLPVSIHGEIIQIGAVRVSQDRQVLDEFSVLVRPTFYHRLNRRISSLTGIREARLKAEGVPFPEAIESFLNWCGEDAVLLTWGFDDIMILNENLRLHRLPTDWTQRWYNVQMIFNAQTDGKTSQRALSTAMQMLSLEATRPAHDALGDAYHTALICTRLDLQAGIGNYQTALRAHEDGPNGEEAPGCLERKVFRNYSDQRTAVQAMAGTENCCPQCGRKMEMKSEWYSQQGHRLTAKAACEEHGEMIVRLKLTREGEALRVIRLTYESTSPIAAAFEVLQNKPHAKRRKRPYRGRKTGNQQD